MAKVVNIARQLSFQQRHVPWDPESNVISNYLNG
jgi:hypothetical protein